MRDLIKFELRKLYLRPVTLVAAAGFMVMFIFLTTIYPLGNEEAVNVYDPGNTETNEMTTVFGMRAIEMKKEWTDAFSGTWTNETVRNILTEYRAAMNDPKNTTGVLNEDAMYWRELQQQYEGWSERDIKAFNEKNPIYFYKPEFLFGESNKWIPVEFLAREFYATPVESIPTLSEMFPALQTEPVFGWHDGPLKTAKNLSDRIGMFVALIIIMALAPIFAEERSLRTESILLSAKHGRNWQIGAKIIAAAVFSLSVLAVFFALDVAIHGLIYGFDGWGLPVQLDEQTFHIPYAISFGGYVGYSMLCITAGTLCLTAIQLMISALAKTPFSSLLIGAVYFFLSMFIHGMVTPEARKYAAMLPVMLFQPDTYISAVETLNFGFTSPSLNASAAFAAGICSIAVILWCKHHFKRRMSV